MMAELVRESVLQITAATLDRFSERPPRGGLFIAYCRLTPEGLSEPIAAVAWGPGVSVKFGRLRAAAICGALGVFVSGTASAPDLISALAWGDLP